MRTADLSAWAHLVDLAFFGAFLVAIGLWVLCHVGLLGCQEANDHGADPFLAFAYAVLGVNVSETPLMQ